LCRTARWPCDRCHAKQTDFGRFAHQQFILDIWRQHQFSLLAQKPSGPATPVCYDRDGTLDARELKGRLSAKELAAADPDHDGTLTKDEYLAVVEQRFKAANRDADDTIDAKEFGSKAGRALQRLIK
jgi:hypothetical protein